MDTSATVRKAMTDAEKQKHRREGRGFERPPSGEHIARNCPEKCALQGCHYHDDLQRSRAHPRSREDLSNGGTLADYVLKLSDEARKAFTQKMIAAGKKLCTVRMICSWKLPVV
jgi:hypothetical protein